MVSPVDDYVFRSRDFTKRKSYQLGTTYNTKPESIIAFLLTLYMDMLIFNVYCQTLYIKADLRLSHGWENTPTKYSLKKRFTIREKRQKSPRKQKWKTLHQTLHGPSVCLENEILQ